MTDTIKSTNVNNWVQAIGILLAGIWAIYNFGYKVWYQPRQQVPFLEMEMKLENVGRSSEKNAIAILATIEGINSSKRSFSIADAYLEVWADKIVVSQSDATIFTENTSKAILTYGGMLSRHFSHRVSERVFVCGIFHNFRFEPGEKLAIQRLFHIPTDTYDQLEANAWALSCPKTSELTIRHKVKSNLIEWIIVREEDGKKIEYVQGSDGFKQLSLRRELAKSKANAPLTLWTEK